MSDSIETLVTKLKYGQPLTGFEWFLVGVNRGARVAWLTFGWALAFLLIAGALSLGCGLGLVILWTLGRLLLSAVAWVWLLA